MAIPTMSCGVYKELAAKVPTEEGQRLFQEILHRTTLREGTKELLVICSQRSFKDLDNDNALLCRISCEPLAQLMFIQDPNYRFWVESNHKANPEHSECWSPDQWAVYRLTKAQ